MTAKKLSPSVGLYLTRVRQITDCHCGPAVVQMLLSAVNIRATQEQLTEAAGASATIYTHGTRVDQLAQAVRTISPDVQFWYKEKSRLRDLTTLVMCHRCPVGVEWQGIFEGEDDDGHYCIVHHVDIQKRHLVMIDPYKHYIEQDRIFPFSVFRPRWWDYNEVIDPATGQPIDVKDDRMMFIITQKDAAFPELLGMRQYE